MSTETFLPQGYEAPKTGGYSELEDGENKFRILANPLPFWIVWTGGNPTRLPYMVNGQVTDKPAKGSGEKDSVKESWGLVVFNYKTKQIEVLEISQATIKKALIAHSSTPSWGHPKNYDINITKTGSGFKTEYAFRADPPTPISDEIAALHAETPVDLSQLLVKDGNPFDVSTPQQASTPEPSTEPAGQAPGAPQKAF